MNEYYLHDSENGKPQAAAQLWRDAHTVDQLASKIRAHLLVGSMWPHLAQAEGPAVLETQEYAP